MLDMLSNIGKRPEMPTLHIAERVVKQMAAAGQQYLEDETGEAMIGVVLPPQGDDAQTAVYVIDTIAPGADALRASHTFQQGGIWQDDVLNWLRENWELGRRSHTPPDGSQQNWDVPLYHVGDWHKQPGFMIQPSGGDLQTAAAIVNERGHRFGFTIAPILTIDHPATVTAPPERTNYVRVEQPNGLMTRIDFWFIGRGMLSFHPISAQVVPDDQFPPLMPYPWHLVSEQRAQQEMQLLEGDGLMVDVLLWDADGQLPLEVCFLTARSGASTFMLLATQPDYPDSPPAAYTLPYSGGIQPDEDLYHLLERTWAKAAIVPVADFQWTPGKTLLEYMHAAEVALGWREPTPEPQPTSPSPSDEEQP